MEYYIKIFCSTFRYADYTVVLKTKLMVSGQEQLETTTKLFSVCEKYNKSEINP